MPTDPVVRPLSVDENIYAICDESGRTVGTGTREVCEVLLHIITKSNQPDIRLRPGASSVGRANVRAAITI
jgi:hypothetical protein